MNTNKTNIACVLALAGILPSCSLFQGARTLIVGESPVVTLDQQDVQSLVTPAFRELNESIPDDVIPEPIIVVDVIGVGTAQEQLNDGLQKVDFRLDEIRPKLESTILAQAQDCSWSPASQKAVGAAMREAGIRPDQVLVPERRRRLRDVLGESRGAVLGHVLYAQVTVARSTANLGHATFGLDLSLVSVDGEESWSGRGQIDKRLPAIGVGEALEEGRSVYDGLMSIFNQ